jgi:hypothetical protein
VLLGESMSGIALIGPAGCGKDYLGGILVKDHGYTRVAFADPLRDVAGDLFPKTKDWLTPDKKDMVIPEYGLSARDIWIKLSKTIRDIDDNIWVNRTLDNISKISGDIVLTDCRTRAEMVALEGVGFKFVYIESALNNKQSNMYDILNTNTLRSLCSNIYHNSDGVSYKSNDEWISYVYSLE